MEEDDTATDMDEEYADDDDDNEEEEAIAVAEEVELEGWLKRTKTASIVWEAYLQCTTKHGKSNRFLAKCIFCGEEMDGKVDLLRKHIISICKKVDFDTRLKIMKMEWKGHTTTATERTNTEEVDSPWMASGISTTASASMSSCALKKRGMNQVYNGSQSK